MAGQSPGIERPRKRAETKKGDKTRERILRASRQVFARYSFKAASTRMIAQQAGVDHPLIHYYFRDKNKLFEAVAKQIYEEASRANLEWLSGLENLSPRQGLELYLERLLQWNQDNPEPLRIILLNMAQIGSLEEVPGYQYIIMHLEQTRKTLMERLPLKGAGAELEMFIQCFNVLVISLLGASACQAQVLSLEEEPARYREWVKNALLNLFAPWLTRLIREPAAGEGE